MPSRIIREQICTSDTLAGVSAEAERLFWRIVVQADDFGLFDARPKIILGKCLTSLIGSVTEGDVERWLQELESAELLYRYEVYGRPYLRLTTWDKHQRPPKTSSKPRFPLPPSTGIPEVPGSSGQPQELPAKGYGVRGMEEGAANASALAPAPPGEPEEPSPFTGDIERDAATLVTLYHEFSPVTGKDAVRLNTRRNKEMTAALKAGCKPETLAAVIREFAASDMPPWEVRAEACRREGIGRWARSPRASPKLDYETWRKRFLDAASGTYTEDELRSIYEREVVGVGAG